jgi:hypothetical protein
MATATDRKSRPKKYTCHFKARQKQVLRRKLLAWYADWCCDALAKLPGCVGIRQLVSVSGWAKHGVLYEFLSRQARDAHFPHLREMYPAEGEWSNRAVVKLVHSPESPIVGSRIWPPVQVSQLTDGLERDHAHRVVRPGDQDRPALAEQFAGQEPGGPSDSGGVHAAPDSELGQHVAQPFIGQRDRD